MRKFVRGLAVVAVSTSVVFGVAQGVASADPLGNSEGGSGGGLLGDSGNGQVDPGGLLGSGSSPTDPGGVLKSKGEDSNPVDGLLGPSTSLIPGL
jgi:hypothetical protein